MFADSSIALNFAISEDKIRYIVNYGIAPYFKGLLIDEIKKSLCHSISFDESMNSKTQECQLDLVIRFWDEVNNQVKNRYWDSDFIGHSTAADILKHFKGGTEKLDDSKMMDGPATNWKFLSLLVADRDLEQLPKLVNIGSCSLHTIHGAFKTGAESTNWNVKATLKGAFQFLHDTPARRDDYWRNWVYAISTVFLCNSMDRRQCCC